MLQLHIVFGICALFAGITALAVQKGSYIHKISGKIFAASIVFVSLSAVYLDLAQGLFPTVALLSGYLVITSVVTVIRAPGAIGVTEKVACIFVCTTALVLLYKGWSLSSTPSPDATSVPAEMYYVFATIAALAAAFDIKLWLKGGIAGKHRIIRHLWRMLLPFVFASMSVLSQKNAIPEQLHGSPLLWLPVLFLLVLLLYWVARVQFSKKMTF